MEIMNAVGARLQSEWETLSSVQGTDIVPAADELKEPSKIDTSGKKRGLGKKKKLQQIKLKLKKKRKMQRQKQKLKRRLKQRLKQKQKLKKRLAKKLKRKLQLLIATA